MHEILALNKRKSEIQQQHSIISAEKCVEKLETDELNGVYLVLILRQ